MPTKQGLPRKTRAQIKEEEEEIKRIEAAKRKAKRVASAKKVTTVKKRAVKV